MIPAFEIGAVVTLTAGGPLMTVVELSGGQARVAWCDEMAKPHELVVDTRALRIQVPA